MGVRNGTRIELGAGDAQSGPVDGKKIPRASRSCQVVLHVRSNLLQGDVAIYWKLEPMTDVSIRTENRPGYEVVRGRNKAD